ncbi:MAG: hypothetical protein CMM95_02685 [Rickettsiales bacterium]|nr:hypothetical protein [Rickettsiales bacterium]|tara:strand:+ start:1747 stop:2049 length:303 start_codon:yes stop_codon:yes gene_type:complete
MTPLSVKVSSDKRHLQVCYDKKTTLVLPSSFLRACSPSAENKKNLNNPQTNLYQRILIKKIESVGNYALRIIFSDNHNTGIYSWEFLYKIGAKFQDSLIP